MNYSSHRGYTRGATATVPTHRYYNDGLDLRDLDYEYQVMQDERLNQEMESLEMAKVALVSKQRKGK